MTTPSLASWRPRAVELDKQSIQARGEECTLHASHISHISGSSRHLSHPMMPFPVAVDGAVRPGRGVWQEIGRLLSRGKLGTGGFLPLPQRGRAWQQQSETLAAGPPTGILRCPSLSPAAPAST